MKLRRSILMFIVAGSVGGCGGVPGAREEVRRSAEPIIGGVIDPGDPAVVALTDDQGYYFCSGTIVDPIHVVTAAHCVNEGPPPAYIFICADNNDDFGDECVLEVSGAEYNPAYQGDSANDIAVVTLSQPTNIKPIPIPPQSLSQSDVGSLTRLIGYGDDENGGTGVKRQVTRPIDELDSSTFTMWGTPNHCYGDSGGPALWPAGSPNEMLVGVTSAGTEDSCEQGGGVDAMVGDNLGWLGSMGVVPADGTGGGSASSSAASSGASTGASSTSSTGAGVGVGVGGGDPGGFGGSDGDGSEPHSDASDEEATDDSGCSYGGRPSGGSAAWIVLALGALFRRRRALAASVDASPRRD